MLRLAATPAAAPAAAASALARLRAAAQRLVDLVLPPRCLGCGQVVAAEGTFCPACWGSLRFLGEGEGCDVCGAPVAGLEIRFPGWKCPACLASPPPFARARAAFLYDGAAREAILAFKHADRPDHARVLGRHMARAASGLLAEPEAVLVPVPLHRWRLWRRGYNQAALLARALARETGRPWLPDALVRVRAAPPQQGLSRAQRRRNLRGAFRVTAAGRRRIAGRVVVLVDDVMTTGSTARQCSRVLLAAGAAEVRVAALARVGAGAEF